MGHPARSRGRRSRLGGAGLALAAIWLGAAVLAASAAATIRVGSDLSGTLGNPAEPSRCAPIPAPCTDLLGGVHKGNGFPATSPTDGTVVAFEIESGGAEAVTFRLGRIEKTVEAEGQTTATGPTVTLPGAGIYSFPTSLPISVGESPGIDSSLQSSYGACFERAYYYSYNPPLVDGAPAVPAGANSVCELMVNAVVEPSSVFGLGRIGLKRSSGGAILTLNLPGPGMVIVSGRGIRKIQQAARAAGKVSLSIAPVGSIRAKLAQTGSAKVKVKIEFTPSGGTPSTRSKSIRLIER